MEARKRLGLDRVIRFQSGLSSDSGASWPFISGTYSVTLDGEWRVEQMRRYAPGLEYRTTPLPPPYSIRLLQSLRKKSRSGIESAWRTLAGAKAEPFYGFYRYD